jgi:glycerol-3-phosphate dehydrogenase (NAD(P)+)
MSAESGLHFGGDARRVAVIGAGNWGTALSLTLANLGHSVTLWAHEKEVVESILGSRENELFMPGVRLPESIVPTTELAEALEGAEFLLTVMPSHVCRALYELMLPHLRPEVIVVSATKGIDTEHLMRMSEVIRSVIGPRFDQRLTVLSGPSFAKEVVRGDPTAVVVASEDREAARSVQEILSSQTLRLYTSSDVVGVELGGERAAHVVQVQVVNVRALSPRHAVDARHGQVEGKTH